MKILVINGPNLNMLGIREKEIYGEKSYAELCAFIEECCSAEGAECEIFQSNHEGAIVDRIQRSYGAADAIVINRRPIRTRASPFSTRCARSRFPPWRCI